MDNTKTLRVVFTGEATSLQRAFKTVQTQGASTAKQLDTVGSSLKKTGAELSSLGSTMTAAFTVPILGIGAAAAKMAMDFQQQMTYVRTDAGDTTDDIDKLSQSVLNLSKTSQFGPEQLAQGLYHIASLGLRGADAMNALNTAQQMASVGGANLEDTTSALGAAIVTGIKGVQDYSQAAGTLDAVIGAGNMRMQDLVSALGSGILPVAKNAGLSLTDVGAALATLTDNGMSAEESATRLRMTFALMEAPSKKAQNVLESIGMTSTQMAMDMRTKGLIPALQDLNQHMLDTFGTTDEGKTKMAQALTEIFGGGRSSAAAQTLIEQLSRVQSKYTQISEQSGEFATKVAEQQETASAKIKTAWSAIQADMIQFGGAILPTLANAFTDVTNEVEKLDKWWNGLTDSQQKLIEKTLLVTAVLGPGLSVLGKLIGTFGTLANLGGIAAYGIGKIAGAIKGIAGLGAGASGLAGLETEAAGAAEGATGLAAVLMGPVGAALGATALAVGGAYLLYKKFTDAGKENAESLKEYVYPATQDYWRLAKDLGVTLKDTAGNATLLSLAQTQVTNDTTLVSAATRQVNDLQKKHADNQVILKQSSLDVADAQKQVTDALDKFGLNSPQYENAVATLQDKQDAYNTSINTAIGYSLDLQKKEGDLRQAEADLKGDTIDLGNAQDYLNSKLSEGVGVVATYGPTALAQVGSIQILQGQISGLSIAWNSAYQSVNLQAPALGNVINGLGSHISSVQGQVNSLNNTLRSSGSAGVTIQSSIGSLQGGHLAGGTDYAVGGMTLVGEKGPEIVNMARGSQVIPADKSAAAMSGNGGTVNLTVQIGLVVGNNIQDLAATIYRELQRLSRANGFNGALPNIGVAPTG